MNMHVVEKLNWDNVRVFLAVARAGQILAAARKLGMDHATASRHLAALENSLGTRLVERRTSGCLLTDSGERLLEVAERVESELLHAQSDLTNAGLSVTGTVSVTAPESFGVFLASRFAMLMETYPDLSIRLVVQPQGVSLSRRDADLAVMLERPKEGRLAVRKLVDFSSGIFASRALVERVGLVTDRSTLRSWTLVTGPEEGATAAVEIRGVDLRSLMGRHLHCGSIAGQIAAIEAGMGIGVLPKYIATNAPGLMQVLPESVCSQELHIVTHLDVREIRRIQEVHRFILMQVKEHAELFT